VSSIFKFSLVVVFLVAFVSCARKGRPEGGPKDETAPLLVTANPPYKTTLFSTNEIRIHFDEYITLKDIQKQLVVSPPLKYPPVITPQGTPSKYINIKILDTLTLNTTYIFNFGNAVQDNNERNVLESFKYVFSTGTYIDSLTTSGNIKDAFLRKTDKGINVLLYKIDSNYTDSIIYKRKPSYVANTLDSTNFNFSNLHKGNYFLVALKEDSNDYLFNSKTEQVGFLLDTIKLPRDSIIKKSIKLFKEIQPYKFKKAKEASKGKIIFGYTGQITDFKVNILSDVPSGFKSIAKFEKGKDTLNYWYTPFKADSILFLVTNKGQIDTVKVRLRKKKKDSLLINSTVSRTLHLRDTFFLKTNNPTLKVDETKILLTDKDTVSVKFKSLLSSDENKIGIIFDKKPSQKYRLQVFPKAIKDIFLQENDTLKYHFITKEIEDYGRIILDVRNINNNNLIIELLTNKGALIERKYIYNSQIISFKQLKSTKYIIRAIIDTNKNQQWDTGNYLLKRQPEKVIYFEKEIEVRANYYMNEVFTINK